MCSIYVFTYCLCMKVARDRKRQEYTNTVCVLCSGKIVRILGEGEGEGEGDINTSEIELRLGISYLIILIQYKRKLFSLVK